VKLTSSLTTPTRRASMKKTMIDGGYPRAFVEETIDLAFLAIDRAIDAVTTTCAVTPHPVVMMQAQSMAMQLLAVEFEFQAKAHVEAMTDISRAHGEEPNGMMSTDPAAKGKG